VLKQTIETGEAVDRPDLQASMETITALFDYDTVAKLETEFLYDEQLDRKYGEGAREYVIKGQRS
jgi:hypothetical protein